MSIRTSPCDWPALYQCEVDFEPWGSLPASGQAIYEGMAADYLWNWTGKTLGVCEVTINPCREDCTAWLNTFSGSGPFPRPGGRWRPVIINGLWYNLSCGRCGDDCGCGGASPLKIPGPIVSITEILEDGEVVSEESYHVENNVLLVRTDGQRWNPCSLEITYERGVAVPAGGQVAAGVLAVELFKAACQDRSCSLPQRIQTITRQGVTVAMLDSFDDIDKGHTGIWIIDSWIASIMKPQPRARVLSPDVPRQNPRRRTWP